MVIYFPRRRVNGTADDADLTDLNGFSERVRKRLYHKSDETNRGQILFFTTEARRHGDTEMFFLDRIDRIYRN